VNDALRIVLDRFGSLHILVNNAGISRGTPLDEISPAEWDLLMRVNLKGPFLWTQAAAVPMKAAGFGRIVNLSSIAAIAGGGFVGTAHYAASKAGLIALTKAAAKTYGSFGITVNAVAPGPIRTRLSESWVPTRENEVAAGIPVRRIGEPDDIAAAVMYLASRESSFVSGHTLVVDGGVTIAAAKNIV
jgi:3-oxoacyl-[acyl-carrier protein] reductase